MIRWLNKYKGLLLKAALAAATLGYLIYFVEFDQIVAIAQGAEWGWLLVALALLPLNVLLEGWVWHLLVRNVVPGLPWRRSLGALMSGFALGLVTPMRAGELAGRAFYLRHPDKWELAAVVFVQRLFDMAVFVDVGLGALYYFMTWQGLWSEPGWLVVAAYGTGAGITVTAALLFPKGSHGLLMRVVRREKVRAHVAFLGALHSRQSAGYFIIALARYLVNVLQFILLVLAFAPAADAATVALGVMLVLFAKLLIPSFTFMDLGIREGAAVFFFGMLGLSQAVAFNASLLLFGVVILLPAALGIPFLFSLQLGRKDRAPDPRIDETMPQAP